MIDMNKFFPEPNAFDTGELKEKYKLFDDTFLFVFEKKLVIVKTNKSGDIVRMSIFGFGSKT